ncbi:glycoside hydrolase family 2 protein [Pararcticibacter amylolyticus]|uniref:Glycoside hydrolase family 2 n=1 Tax=Pararcticibacter amylolyticus TaxID=2173175 RepID=A0A2U2PHD9_9SPHI|nr:sugar-binding domain-containing protein [Pararcticibacter amylolyticus]PWG80816.1 glycoside hydrolase family 2 [Pararcticibacter amylolyticus]
MKEFIKRIIITVLPVMPLLATAQQYKVQPLPIQTRWTKEVAPANALPEYPRPQLKRKDWQNLNGLWNYAITKKDVAQPANFQGQILVPYPIESALSGVRKVLHPNENLWYKRTFTYNGKGKTLLHFGAVDFEATVLINGKEAGKHTGGYTEFTYDITSLLKNGENEIVVKVWDPSDQGYGPHGKQVLNPQSIYYTPTSGIWQTVWLERVPDIYVERLTITPDIDEKVVNIVVHSLLNAAVTLTAAGKTVEGKTNSNIVIPITNMRLWSVSDPYLYDLNVKLGSDEVKSYFGMRKISITKDEQGVDRIALNNQPYFNLGTLDQGFWPDGLYTAPTDAALKFDIEAIKAMGFNTIRKHIKIEPARWYYYADKLGMLVWQDFVNPNQGLPEGAKPAFEKQAAEELVQLHNNPSIICWVLFNEKWGQYDQQRLTEWVKKTDPSRIVNGHTGELLYVNEQLRSPSPNTYVSADMTDVHAYPDPMMPIKQPGKAQVVGEFGGIGVFIPDHQWLTGSAWGYIQEKPAALAGKYRIMNQHLQLLKKEGLSGSIYTQPFDVEGEQNGLMTYDREVVKVPFSELRKIHSQLNPDANTNVPVVTAKDADLTEPAQVYADAIQQYINGKHDAAFLKRLTMLAGQTNDLAGKARFGNDYLATLKAPYSVEDIVFIDGMTKKVSDKGFASLLARAKTDRTAYVKAMNTIFTDVIQPYVPTPDAKPNWNEVESKIKDFGSPGEEIYLRAKVIHTYNQQDWNTYKPAAKAYLDKYSTNIKENEKAMFQKAIQEH